MTKLARTLEATDVQVDLRAGVCKRDSDGGPSTPCSATKLHRVFVSSGFRGAFFSGVLCKILQLCPSMVIIQKNTSIPIY